MLCLLQHDACGTSSGFQTEPAGREDKDRREGHPRLPRSGMSCYYTTCVVRTTRTRHAHCLISPLSCAATQNMHSPLCTPNLQTLPLQVQVTHPWLRWASLVTDSTNFLFSVATA